MRRREEEKLRRLLDEMDDAAEDFTEYARKLGTRDQLEAFYALNYRAEGIASRARTERENVPFD